MRIYTMKIDGIVQHKGTVEGHSQVTHLLISLLPKELYYD